MKAAEGIRKYSKITALGAAAVSVHTGSFAATKITLAAILIRGLSVGIQNQMLQKTLSY